MSHRAQIEIDASFESPEKIFLFEAKIRNPHSFNIRQLYFPFRTLEIHKPVRSFFFCFEPEEKMYLFWEYKFVHPYNFNSIKLIRSKQFQIGVSKVISVRDYQKPLDRNKTNMPQADDINKIIQFPLRVSEGYNTSKKIREIFGFVIRQSSYYSQASEILGLISRDKDGYKLTKRGNLFLKLPSEKRSKFIFKQLLEFPVVLEIFIEVMSDPGRLVSKQEIIDIIKEKSHVKGSTLGRRAQTIISWFKWIRNNLGIVEVDKKGNISRYRQNIIQERSK